MPQNIPGFTGLSYGRISSQDKRFIGKFTDSNHLESFHQIAPSEYDKKIISLYTQSSSYSNDFLDMINKSTPYYLDGMSDTFAWKVTKPYMFPKIVQVPDSTASQSNIGIDGKEFEFVADAPFGIHAIVSIGHRMYGPQVYITKDPVPYGTGWLHTATLVSDIVGATIGTQFLQVGMELVEISGSIGEFDQDAPGLQNLAESIEMFETLGSEFMKTHHITGWADDKRIKQKDQFGNPLDIMYYANYRNGQIQNSKDVRWEPFVETLMRREMLSLKVNRMIWSKPGTARTSGSKQELKKVSAGVYHQMKSMGNYVSYNRGEFSANLIRNVFGDLFYRRVDIKDRHVKMYTNEAGFDAFQQAIKEDAFNSGLTLMTNVDAVKSGNIGVADTSQKLTYSFAFDSFVTRETGRVELIHLKELDLPQTNLEFGQNKKSTPVFMVFNVSPSVDGGIITNVREVRRAGRPNMLWGYIHGTRHHLGAAASQGMISSGMFDGYKIWMKDRCDAFVEDTSRCVLIEEKPTF